MIQVLKQPIDLSDLELIEVYKSANVCSFDKWIYDDLKIQRDLHSQIPTISIVCDNTGFNLFIRGEYEIELLSSIGHKSVVSTIELIKCLIKISAIKYN